MWNPRLTAASATSWDSVKQCMTPDFGRPLLPHDAQRVLGGFPRVDDQGFPAIARGADMGAKALALPLEVAAHAVVIEAGLADRDNPRMARKLDQPRRIHRGAVLVVRMHAHAREKIVVGLGKTQ